MYALFSLGRVCFQTHATAISFWYSSTDRRFDIYICIYVYQLVWIVVADDDSVWRKLCARQFPNSFINHLEFFFSNFNTRTIISTFRFHFFFSSFPFGFSLFTIAEECCPMCRTVGRTFFYEFFTIFFLLLLFSHMHHRTHCQNGNTLRQCMHWVARNSEKNSHFYN